jgi:DNA-binding transcriptional LysR family regulator
MNLERLSLDQLRVFRQVAEAGSFTRAAERLGRAQSAVSYAVSTLEHQLGVALFDRSGYRPALTRAGESLLRDARDILDRTDRFLARAQGLGAGLEHELAIAVDVMFPQEVFVTLLREFQERFATVGVRIYTDILGAIPERLLNGSCQVGITCSLSRLPDELTAYAMPSISLIPVAAPDHPLARPGPPLEDPKLRDHVQLVVTDRSRRTEGEDFSVYSARTWRLSDLWTKHQFLVEGMGWGFLPVHIAAPGLARGQLVRLELAQHEGEERQPVYHAYPRDRATGPAGSWLAERLTAIEGY